MRIRRHQVGDLQFPQLSSDLRLCHSLELVALLTKRLYGVVSRAISKCCRYPLWQLVKMCVSALKRSYSVFNWNNSETSYIIYRGVYDRDDILLTGWLSERGIWPHRIPTGYYLNDRRDWSLRGFHGGGITPVSTSTICGNQNTIIINTVNSPCRWRNPTIRKNDTMINTQIAIVRCVSPSIHLLDGLWWPVG